MLVIPTATQHETPDPSSPQRSRTTCELPAELLEQIIEEVELLDDGVSEIKKNKIQSIHRGSTRCEIYSNDHTPILTTFQSLAVADRQLYRLLRPRLWEGLCFPSVLPTLMSQWDDIIFNNREFVRFIEIDLSHAWLYWAPDRISGPDCDNLIVYRNNNTLGQRRGLSPKNVTKILSVLPNLERLRVTLPRNRGIEADDDVALDEGMEVDMDEGVDENVDAIDCENGSTLIYLRLKPIITQLPGLRHLAINENQDSVILHAPVADSHMIDMIKCLPLLESLKCAQLYRSSPESSDPTDRLEWHLAQLHNFSSLDLDSCDNFDITWSEQNWPKKITRLRLFLCSKIDFGELHRLLPHFAPNLIELDIGPIFSGIETSQDNFVIPTLTDLKLNLTQGPNSGATPCLLNHFGHCPRLQSIDHCFVRSDEWVPIADLVCASTWPELEYLNLGTGGNRTAIHGPPEALLAVTRLQTFCRKNNVVLHHPKDNE